MPGFEIKYFPFDVENHCVTGLDSHPKGKNWPVVYLIHNDGELYIGETNSAFNRMNQHLDNVDRQRLQHVRIIFDKEFNKSAILDIEQSLIHLYSVDGKYVLQNRNGGQSKKHDYYQREKYLNKIDDIWGHLHSLGMTSKSILDIRNSDCYKYSPYNSLTEEQNQVCISTLNSILDNLINQDKGITIIQGSAGTGKSVVLMNMIFQLANCQSFDVSFSEEDDDLTDYQNILHKVQHYLREHNKEELKIAYVIAMTSFRDTIKQVFSITKHGLKGQMVIGPSEIKGADVDNKYDVLFVDESHRLARRKNISYMGAFDAKCRELFGDDCDVTNYTQLDWILAGAKNVVLIYDDGQRVAGSDITSDQFWNSIDNSNFSIKIKTLGTQMRCQGGTEFASYLQSILDCESPDVLAVENYDFKLFSNISELISEIHNRESEHKLCRVVAGYSWKWISKGLRSAEEVIQQGMQDITIDGQKYIWNMTNSAWILSDNAINEIGCIHTTQGYDLNYVGVIFGREIDYDPISNKIVIYKDLFFDKKAKNGSTAEQLKNYIINAYRTIMLRGIRGCYVYAYNKNLRDYLSQFINIVNSDDEIEDKIEQPCTRQMVVEPDVINKHHEIFGEEDIDEEDKYVRFFPLYTIKAACGRYLEQDTEASIKGWIDIHQYGIHKHGSEYFIVQASGNSMLPLIHDGDYCLFRHGGSIHRGDVAIAGINDLDPLYNGRYTIKDFWQEFIENDGIRERVSVTLKPRNNNGEYPEYSLTEDNNDGFGVFGVLEEVLK